MARLYINKVCFVCGTKYHIFNIVNYILNQKEYDFNTVDIFLNTTNSYLKNTLSRYLPVDNIYCFGYNNGILSRFIRIVKPAKFVNFQCQSRINIDYDLIFIPNFGAFSRAMVLGSSSISKFCFYEDGLANYTRSNMDITKTPWYTKLFYRFFCIKYNKIYSPLALYVNNPKLCLSPYTTNVKQLPPVNENTLNMLDCILNNYGLIKYLYKKYKPIYLGQAKINEPYYNEFMRCVDKKLKYIKIDFIYRPHPSEKNNKIEWDNNCHADTSGFLWESICSEVIDDDHILIGFNSTAQAVPKLIFNKEPWLVFTYKILQSRIDTLPNDIKNSYKMFDFKNIDIFINKLKSSYSKPEKIIILKDYEDIESILKELYTKFINKKKG